MMAFLIPDVCRYAQICRDFFKARKKHGLHVSDLKVKTGQGLFNIHQWFTIVSHSLTPISREKRGQETSVTYENA
jgi:hypothetical protein